MSTGYSWEGIRQVRVTLLCARHVPERLCGGYVYLGRYIKCSTFTFMDGHLEWLPKKSHMIVCSCHVSAEARQQQKSVSFSELSKFEN